MHLEQVVHDTVQPPLDAHLLLAPVTESIEAEI